VTFIVYGVTGDRFWLNVAEIANWAGVVMACVAAVPGLVDWATGIPRRSAAKKTGLVHMGLNVAALAIFLVNAIIYWNYRPNELPDAGTGIVLAAIGVLLTIPAGFLGWNLVQDHHVGVNLSAGQETLEPMTTVAVGQPQPPSDPSYVRR
jgi:uncharacterized membrane protein